MQNLHAEFASLPDDYHNISLALKIAGHSETNQPRIVSFQDIFRRHPELHTSSIWQIRRITLPELEESLTLIPGTCVSCSLPDLIALEFCITAHNSKTQLCQCLHANYMQIITVLQVLGERFSPVGDNPIILGLSRRPWRWRSFRDESDSDSLRLAW